MATDSAKEVPASGESGRSSLDVRGGVILFGIVNGEDGLHLNTVTCEWQETKPRNDHQSHHPLTLTGSTANIFNDLQIAGAVFAALLGLAFGSFLSVFLTRFPEGESIVSPRSHCRNCDHILAWWENLPLLSWIILRGRCRKCHNWIGLRYPFIELTMGLLWVACWIRFSRLIFYPSDTGNSEIPHLLVHSIIQVVGYALLCWLLVALATLDAEHFWLPDWLTIPGAALGFIFSLLEYETGDHFAQQKSLFHHATGSLLAILAAAAVVLIIRLAYWLIRRKEGMGLGDAKLMAMLGAWLGLFGALKCFAIAVFAAAAAAVIWLIVLSIRRRTGEWAKMPLPLGTFLCAAALIVVFFPDWPFTIAELGF